MADLNQMVQNLKTALSLDSPIDDGTDGDRGDLFGTGDTYNYLTYPGGPEVVNGGNGSGTIKYPYTSRERHKHYVATAETATEDNDKNGVVTANYDFTFTGKVLITSIVNNGKTRLSGNCIENRLQSLNGAQMG
jgi:hypothetical protein